jgi:hypothetical protein
VGSDMRTSPYTEAPPKGGWGFRGVQRRGDRFTSRVRFYLTMFTLRVTVFAVATLALLAETVRVKLPTGAPFGPPLALLLPLPLPLLAPQPKRKRPTARKQNAAKEVSQPLRLRKGSSTPARAKVEVTAAIHVFTEKGPAAG